MPSKSKAQQKLFGMALAYKRGDIKNVSAEVKNLADELTMKQLEDFATKKIEETVKVKKYKDFVLDLND